MLAVEIAVAPDLASSTELESPASSSCADRRQTVVIGAQILTSQPG
jgi:hypothetical protein